MYFFFSIRTKIRSPLETSIYILREFFFIFFFLQQTIYELFEMVDSIFYIYICHDTTRYLDVLEIQAANS